MRERTVIRYYGGKNMLAPWIIEHMPQHRVYVEPFAGAASVLMRKDRSYSEVINDLDGEIVNLFRILRDRTTAEQLRRLLELTPYARQEFELSYQSTEDLVEQARRTVIRAFMGFGTNSHNRPTGFRANANRNGTTPAHDWMHYPANIEKFTEHLQGVVIENRPAIEIIRQQDSETTLFYVDPPYVFDTRGKTQIGNYRHEMSDEDHRELSAVLHGVKGLVLLSGYPCPLYEELYQGWSMVQRVAHADGARERTEVLWMNYEHVQRRLF